MQTNRECTFLELLESCETVMIPKIQRDYAQGRKDSTGSVMYQEVRESFLDTFKRALLGDKKIVLDYIYGSKDSSGFFYPDDGQQRLTTLFLIHWFIAKQEELLDIGLKKQLRKFSYETRDTSMEFCKSLLDIDVDFSDQDVAIDLQIKNSKLYFFAFNYDPTVQSMLRMISEIDKIFRRKTGLWGKLKNITFWVLFLERYGLSDDIFVKMNARGKRLSSFDAFKSDLESSLDKDLLGEEIVDVWKTSIDNNYLDSFFIDFGKELAERNIYRTLMFFVKGLMAAHSPSDKYDDQWEQHDSSNSYKKEIEFIRSNSHNLELICNLLNSYSEWHSTDDSLESLYIPKGKGSDYSPNTIRGDIKVKLFGILYWFSTGICSKTNHQNFVDFKRIMENYLFSRRQPNIKPRNFSSSIDNSNIGKELQFIKNVIDNYCFSSYGCFHDFVLGTDEEGLSLERDKLHYGHLNEIIKLERIPQLCTVIGNFFFDGMVVLDGESVSKILSSKELTNKAMRIILSFAEQKYGMFNDLVFDGTTKQSGSRQLHYDSATDIATAYCHKYFITQGQAEFGDKILTASINGHTEQEQDTAKAVRKFVKEVKERLDNGSSVPEALDCILNQRIDSLDFSNPENILPYIVKYDAFFFTPTYTTFLVLRRKDYDTYVDDNNIYDIRCINADYNLFSENHYQPFYKALADYLDGHGSDIRVISGIEFSGNQIEYAYPCTLSNGWIIRITHAGEWIINGKSPGLMPLGSDCISLLGDYLLA